MDDSQPDTLLNQWPPPPLLKPYQAPDWVPSTARPQYARMDSLKVTWHRSRIARVGFALLGLSAASFAIVAIWSAAK